MPFVLTKNRDLPKKEVAEMRIEQLPTIGTCDVIVAETETGHNQEFYHTESTFQYLIIDGSGSFFLDDQEVPVEEGDLLVIEPNTRIYYKGKMRLVLITTPPWKAEHEVVTRARIW